MRHELSALPYAHTALEPHISAETLEYHHGKHHAKYVANLNDLIPRTRFENMPLEEIVREADGAIFNNAAQAWNHAFYWHCLSPDGGGEPDETLTAEINKHFGSLAGFRQKFTDLATTLFGSGWTWLIRNPDGSLAIENFGNAGTPLREKDRGPLLTCDVWEHAYYIDYRNARPKYVEAFWNLVNWDFVAEQYQARTHASGGI